MKKIPTPARQTICLQTHKGGSLTRHSSLFAKLWGTQPTSAKLLQPQKIFKASEEKSNKLQMKETASWPWFLFARIYGYYVYRMLSAILTPPFEPGQFKQPNIHVNCKFSYIIDFAVLTGEVSSVLPYQAGALNAHILTGQPTGVPSKAWDLPLRVKSKARPAGSYLETRLIVYLYCEVLRFTEDSYKLL